MNHSIPHKSLARRLATFAVVGLLLMTGAMALDRVALGFLAFPTARLHDWHRALRVLGYLPVWLVVGLAFLMVEYPGARAASGGSRWAARGLSLGLSPALAGLGAEALKLILRRERPDNAGEFTGYLFRSFSDGPLRSVGLGLPSSHAMVAFGGAFALCGLFPRGRALWVSLALGCGLTRLLDHAHYPSDVALAALGGYAAAWAIRALFTPGDAPRAGTAEGGGAPRC